MKVPIKKGLSKTLALTLLSLAKKKKNNLLTGSNPMLINLDCILACSRYFIMIDQQTISIELKADNDIYLLINYN